MWCVFLYDCQFVPARSQFRPLHILYNIMGFFNRSTIHNFVIGKDLLFQSASRHINRKHCKCCIHQGLVIWMLNRLFWPSVIGYIPSTYIFGIHVYAFYYRLDRTRIDDESLIGLGNSLSSNSTFRSLRCVAIFSYTQNSVKTFCQFLCDPSLLKGYGIFSRGAYLA